MEKMAFFRFNSAYQGSEFLHRLADGRMLPKFSHISTKEILQP